MSERTITIKGEFSLCDEFPTKKCNFNKLCEDLRKKGYRVKEDLKETMGVEKYEISVLSKGKEVKIFTNSDPYAKEAIIDSDLSKWIPDIIQKIEYIMAEDQNKNLEKKT